MTVRELTVVTFKHYTTEDIVKLIDKEIGYEHDRHYAYGDNRDVVYYIPDERADVVGEILDLNESCMAYNFNDPFIQDETSNYAG